jgi:hypothetical protein
MKRMTSYLLLALIANPIDAQQSSLLHHLSEDEQKAMEAIALYPEPERNAILEASANPGVLVRLKSVQAETQEQFQALLAGLNEGDQKKLFNIARYPELIAAITASGEENSAKEMAALVSAYPEEVQEDATDANRKHFSVLVGINDLFSSSEQATVSILNGYSTNTQDAYRKLLQLPEVMTILIDNMSMTVLLGDLYKRGPTRLIRELDSLSLIVAEQRSQELNEWKQSLEDNPEAMAEYEAAAHQFAREQGYDESDYAYNPDHYVDVHIYHHWRPYSWWFGWPWWYTYEYWYPYPWWYHWGYYYGPGGVVVFVDLPSYWFMHWHFYYYAHFYHYPHFTDHCFGYYYGHRNSYSGLHTVIRNWDDNHRSQLPSGWLEPDGARVDRIKEFGKFKMDYLATAGQALDNAPTEREYLEQNADNYPTLKPVLKEKERVAPVPTPTQPAEQRKYEPIREYQPPKYEPKPKVIEKEPSREREVERAKDHHLNTWPKPQPQPAPSQKPVPQPSPKPREKQKAEPRHAPQPKTTQPGRG